MTYYLKSVGGSLLLVVAWLVSLILCSLIPQGAGGNLDSDSTLSDASAIEFGGGNCEETIEVARKSGYDYPYIVSRCNQRDERAFKDLFWLTKNAGFDAASSEGNAAVLGCLLRGEGDRLFAKALAHEDKETVSAVISELLYDFGWGDNFDDDQRGRALFKEQFPSTFRVYEGIK